MQQKFNQKKNLKSKQKTESTLQDFFNYLSNQHYSVNVLRNSFTSKNDQYQEYKKKNVPCFYLNKLSDNTPSGYLYFDFDLKSKNEVEKTFKKLIKKDFVYAVWRSIGGLGLGCLIKVDSTNVNKEHFKYIASEYLEDLKVSNDTTSDNLNRPTCISFDPEYYINNNVVELVLPVITTTDETKDKYTTKRQKKDIVYKNQLLKELEQGIVRDTLTQLDGFSAFYVKGGFCSPKQLNVYWKKTIEIGKRGKTLNFITNYLIMMSDVRYNNIDRTSIENKVRHINNTYCEEPILEDELKQIFDSAFKNEINYDRAHNKKLILDSNIETRSTAWYKMINKGCGVSKINNNKEIIELTVKHLLDNNIKTTYKNIALYSKDFDFNFKKKHKGVSLRTIKSEIYKEYINTIVNPVQKPVETDETIEQPVKVIKEESPVTSSTELKEVIELDEYTKGLKNFEKRYNKSAHEPLPDNFVILPFF